MQTQELRTIRSARDQPGLLMAYQLHAATPAVPVTSLVEAARAGEFDVVKELMAGAPDEELRDALQEAQQHGQWEAEEALGQALNLKGADQVGCLVCGGAIRSLSARYCLIFYAM